MNKDFDNISAILFDVDGTLYNQRALRRFMAMRIAVSFLTGGMSPRKLRVVVAFRKELENLRCNVPDDCEDIRSVHIESVAKTTNCAESFVEATVRRWMLDEPLPYLSRCLANGVEETLVRLKEANFKLGVLSDYPAKEKLVAMGLADFFDEVISCQDAASDRYKPDCNGFSRLARGLGVSEESCVYVGDRFEIDIIGALDAGMSAVWLSCRTKTRVLPAKCRQITEFSDLERLLL